MADHFTVGETYFFHENQALDVFTERILPSLVQARQHSTRSLRSGAQRVVSEKSPIQLAILLSSCMPNIQDWQVTINRSPAQGLWTAIAESIPFTLEKLVLLKARALEIAKALEATESSILQLEVTEFRFGEEMYALVSTSVCEVDSPKGITPFCALLTIVGIVNVRGRILPVIDLKPFWTAIRHQSGL